MQDRRFRGTPARLARLEKRFTTWRSQREGRARIPEVLWSAAAAAALECGVSQTATVLKLGYYGLKKRMAQQELPLHKSESSTSFVEIPNSIVGFAPECVIEFDNGLGACLRVHLKGTNVPDVLALGRSFWRGE